MLDLVMEPSVVPKDIPRAILDIELLDRELHAEFRGKMDVAPHLTRQLVSFQASKDTPVYRWYKYKEAFSAALVRSLLAKYGVCRGKVLDPFAGSGTALFAAAEMGLDADGIELLSIGQQIIKARSTLQWDFTSADFDALDRWRTAFPWRNSDERRPIGQLRITDGAYPAETQNAMERFLGAAMREREPVSSVLTFALLCILESISFTRKDGQYLRWDARSGRRQGAKPFNKGQIRAFDEAMEDKLAEILEDMRPRPMLLNVEDNSGRHGDAQLMEGSCLEVLSRLEADQYAAIMTSPPYCNRYDYTRTYALELALLGASESDVLRLRQEMLSCTVENREKDLRSINPAWDTAIRLANSQPLLQSILGYLTDQKQQGTLNNTGIPRMIKGYFHEMACVIQECARVMHSGARLFMVNDNVRYAGVSISVDLILSDLAESLGLRTEHILVLPRGKGNSSQQMGQHGRDPLRKCVYVWQKR